MRVSLFATLLVVLFGVSSAQYTVCQNYSGQANSTAATQQALLTAIVVRAVTGGTYNLTAASGSNTTYVIPGLFNATGPLYNIFSGTTQYRVGAPNYLTNTNALNGLAVKLVAYFGQLFGCNATGYPAVSNYNMYAVHANMSINNTMETYFNTQLALTLLSFGVDPLVVNNVAAPALGLFNRCGGPVLGSNSSYLAQICGTADCPLATGASQATCSLYYSPSSSSSSTGGSAPYTPPSTYPAGSVLAGLNFNFASVPNTTYGAMVVAMDIAYNIANETAFAVNQSQVLPYVVITSFNNVSLAPSRRLLQTTSTPVQFVVLGNITNLGSALASATAATTRLVAAAAAGTLIAPNSGATIPAQSVTPVVVSYYSSSSSSSGVAVGSSGGNGASGKYAVSGVLAAVVAIFVSLLL